MRFFARLRARGRALFRRAGLERDMDSELRFHLAARVDDLRRAGLSPEAAAAQARVEFGDPLRWKDDCREARGVRLVDELRADVRYGVRWLRRSPGFAAAAVLSLALGIGANTAVFSLLDTVLLKSLPVSDPASLILFGHRHEAANGPEADHALSYRMFTAYRNRTRASSASSARTSGDPADPEREREPQPERGALADAVAYASFHASIGLDGTATPIARGQLVSGNYYGMLGVPAALGRLIVPDDDRAPGAGAVAVLGHAYWQRQFGGDPRVLHRVIQINGFPFTIIGVSAPGFFGTRVGEAVDVTVPLCMQRQANPVVGESWIEGDGAHQLWLQALGRLAPGATLAQAQAELQGTFQQEAQALIAFAGPKARRYFDRARLVLEPGSRGLSELRRRFARPLMVVMAVVALVLLIACANLANLLLARAAVRRREMAVRVSLGAGRGRLVRQLLTESVILAGAGGLAGLAFAWWASVALAAALVDDPGQALAVSLDVSLDLRVLVFTLGVSLVTGVLFGLVPAIGATRVDPHAALSTGRDDGVGRRRAGLGRWLVAAQVAASLLLLIGAGLFLRTLVNLQRVEAGFTHETVLVTRLEPRGSNQKSQHGDRLRVRYDDLLARVGALPGVRAASLSGATPLGPDASLTMRAIVDPVGPVVAPPAQDADVRLMQVFPSYFATLGVPMLAGRDLTQADNLPDVQKVLVVNETMATRFFGGASAAVGRTVAFGNPSASGPRPAADAMWTIVGVVGDVRDRGPREEIVPQAYATFARTPTGRAQMTLLVRVAGDGSAVTSAIREQVRDLDPAMPLRDIETVAHRLEASLRQERLVALLSGSFGLLALLLACIGLYGVMAYGVARRRAEFGLRMALGARRGDVVWLVLRETLVLIALGVAIGVPLALLASGLIARMLYGLAPTDPATLAAAVLVLASVATLAGYLPARRAARVDPLIALRHE